MTVVFLRIGQEVHIEGDFLEDAVNEGIRQGYAEGYLRKSVVSDPILRENTKDNTPGVIHYEIVPGDKLEITVAPKGFGSENMSRVTAIGLNVETYPTHIAGLPVAINICCHVNRHITRVL